ncbi:MAG: SAM-dependent DNA methyltransferase [Bacteroidaceae bacterium]|nr:SAM-dependent DNA methyltransferase [Bacteroidaceae bacterium]
MEQTQYNQLFSFIWNIATDVLVYAFEKGEYKKIIMPMMVLRRIDVLLEPTKESLLAQKKMLDAHNISNQDPILFNTTGYPFYNSSLFTMKTLKSETDPNRLKMNFINYLNGFSKDVQDILDKFHLRQMVDNLTEAERLGSIIEKFTDEKINLSNKPVLNDDGTVRLPALDNHTMGTMFEELLRKFNEENNVTEAGEHFTPRDYVKLLADLAVLPVSDKIKDNTYTVYDGACGTGGILTIAQDRIKEIATQMGKNVKVLIYGQELQPETFATCKADLMISGDIQSFQYAHGTEMREYIAFDSTISRDGHPGESYDFCISNPPFGTPWKEDLKKRGLAESEKKQFTDSRFVVRDSEDNEISFIPDIGDCQMMFLANNLSRMKDSTELGTRIVEVHNGSSLFTGDAGTGASNLRKYIIENDLLEAIVAMPEKDFYNTGIGTFIWVVTNRKEERRRGFVQLIDATEIKSPLRKNLGEKNCETNETDRQQIVKLLTDFAETPQSKIFPNDEFGYWSVKVCRPLRLKFYYDEEREAEMCRKEKDAAVCCEVMTFVKEYDNSADYDFNELRELLYKAVKKMKSKPKKKHVDLLQKYYTITCPDANIVIDTNGNPVPDKALEDTEIIPLRYEGGIDAFFQNEIVPYTPDAWIDTDSVQEGYELSFTKYFYKPKALRSIEDITHDIRAIEERTDGMLDDILGKV